MDFSGPAFHLVLYLRSTYFIVTLMSACLAAFLKAYSVCEHPHGPWQSLRYFFCVDKLQVVFFCHIHHLLFCLLITTLSFWLLEIILLPFL